MNPSDLIAQIQVAFDALADPQLSARMRAYQRDQFDFLGIPTPQRRAVVTSLATAGLGQQALLDIARDLWRMPFREYQYAAIDLLAHRRKALDAGAVDTLLALAQQQPWWETVDGLAAVIGDVIRQEPARLGQSQALMDRALAHDCMWVRRIAMTHQLGWRLQTDSERLFRYALALAPESEFFIRKAIGWSLRDYAKWCPDPVIAFMTRHRDQFSPLTLREALKHHPDALGA